MAVKVCGGAVGCAVLQNGGPGDRQSGLVEDRSGDTDRIGFRLSGDVDVVSFDAVVYIDGCKQSVADIFDGFVRDGQAYCLVDVYVAVHEKIRRLLLNVVNGCFK